MYQPRAPHQDWFYKTYIMVSEPEEQMEMMDTDPGWEDLKPSDQMVVIRKVQEEFVAIRKLCLPKWKVWVAEVLGVWG